MTEHELRLDKLRRKSHQFGFISTVLWKGPQISDSSFFIHRMLIKLIMSLNSIILCPDLVDCQLYIDSTLLSAESESKSSLCKVKLIH